MRPGDLVKKAFFLDSVRCYIDRDCKDWDYYINTNAAVVLNVEATDTNLKVCKVLVPIGIRYVYLMDIERCDPETCY